MAFLMTATYPASSEGNLAASISPSPDFSQIICPQTSFINNQFTAAEAEARKSPLYLNQQQCSSNIETISRHPNGLNICSRPILNCAPENTSVDPDTVALKETLKPLGHSRRQISFFHRAKPRWPDSEASVGKFCGMKGKYRCWEAKGPAQSSFKILSKDIAALLERACGPVPASSQVIFDVFMIGETPGITVPQIMFSCRKSGPRKEAMETLKKSGILRNYPGFETGHWPFPPHILDPRLLTSWKELDEVIQRTKTNVSRFLVPVHGSSTLQSSSALSPTISAIRLYTVSPSKAGGALLKATLGSLIYFSGKIFYLSVSHAFGENVNDDCELSFEATDDDTDSEFEFGGLVDGEEDFEEFDEQLEMDDNGSMTSESSGSQDDSNNDFVIDDSTESLSFVESDAPFTTQTGMNKSQNIDNFNSTLLIHPTPSVVIDDDQPAIADSATIYLRSTELDYALLELSADNNMALAISMLPIISSGNVSIVPPGETRIIIVTGSNGLSYGILSGRPSYIRLPRSETFQEAYTVTISGPLLPGDSGSVVLNSDTQVIYGHVVVGSTISQTAYIIPASNVLNDLERREETILRTAVELTNLILQTEDSKKEASQRASELPVQPDFVDLLPASWNHGQNMGLADDTSICTYNSSLCSEVESLYSENDSIASSNSSVGEFVSGAISEVVNLFLHSELQGLYPVAIAKLGPEKFQRNFRRLLLRYGRQLLREASNNLEREAAVLVRRSATQIAVQIRESIAQAENTPKISSNPVQLNEWLKAIKSQEDEDDLSDSDESDGWEPPDTALLDTLEEVKSFMVAGRAFSDLCEAFQRWLKLGEDRKDNPSNITTRNTKDELQKLPIPAGNDLPILPSSPGTRGKWIPQAGIESVPSKPVSMISTDDKEPNQRSPYEFEIVVSNFPVETPARLQLPVRLERVFISPDIKSLVGIAAVANLGFDKAVTARFTLDYWKTTSEVLAECSNDLKRDGYDRFNFKIRLADQSNLEAKTMFLCVRYNVNGQEYWDNNNMANFQIDFEKKRTQYPRKPHPKKLFEALVPTEGENLTRLRGIKSFEGLPSAGFQRKPATETNIDSRYDFGASLSTAIHAAKNSLGEKAIRSVKSSPELKGVTLEEQSIPSFDLA